MDTRIPARPYIRIGGQLLEEVMVRRMVSSVMLRLVALVRTDVS
jgi:hypothetical protein